MTVQLNSHRLLRAARHARMVIFYNCHGDVANAVHRDTVDVGAFYEEID